MKKNSKKKTLSLEKIKIAKLENMETVVGGGISDANSGRCLSNLNRCADITIGITQSTKTKTIFI